MTVQSIAQSRSDRRRSGGGRRGRGAAQRQVVPTPSYVERKIPYFDFLSQDQVEAILGEADWMLEEKGIEFRDNPDALRRLADAGADVTGCCVRFPDGMARKLAQTCPTVFTQHARNPNRSVKIGGRNQVFASMYGAPFVRDASGERRYGSMADFDQLAKILHRLPHVHHLGHVICEPVDVPVNKRHLDMVYSLMTTSDKPFLGAITEKDRAQDSVNMARILFGAERMERDTVIMGNVNTNSPLMIDKVASEAIEIYCGAGQGIVVVPFILSGAMGPVSTAASVAQAIAEGLACAAYSQIIRSGAPFVLGNFLSSMSLKSGAPTFGMPEPVMSNYAIGQIARHLGLPLRCGGSLSASKLPDAQAAAESADSMHSTALAGANFVLHAAGWLEGGLVMSYEKLVIDADRLGMYARMLGGLATDENGLARSAYEEVAHAGHFLGSAHTMANYETAFYESPLSDSESFEQWREGGEKDMQQRAYEYWNRLVAEYERPPIDPAIDEALRAYTAKKKEALPDQAY
ncbi:MAG: trimethylamine methyltransferase [Kiloniella sp.]|nr:trimethylamine methyltransferase [Kiloniella sp.]